jgi:hypothetical protein
MSNAPYAQSNPAHEIQLGYGPENEGTEVVLKVDWSSGIGGADWPAANLFCHIVANDLFYKTLFKDKSVVELGSGTGLGGVAVDKMFEPSKVVITDLPQYLQHLEYNIVLNKCSDRVSAAALDWLDMEPFLACDQAQAFDVILALECVYREDLYQPLVDVLVKLSKPDTLVFLGLTRLFAQTKFFRVLQAAGFCYTRVPEHAMPAILRKEQSTADCGLLMLYFRKQ